MATPAVISKYSLCSSKSNDQDTNGHCSGAAYDAGYPAAYVCDENMVDATPYLHTANDALSTMDFDHLHQHVRLTIGFLVEGSYF